MSRLLVVFGATGQQGGSIISHVLADVELSRQYHIRAITRDSTSSKSEELQKSGVEVVEADISDESTLPTALRGAHTVFIWTTPAFGPDAKAVEYRSGTAIADAAVAAGTHYIVFSTLPSIEKLSGGKYTKVSGFDAKADVEAYIRGLPIQSAFFAAGSFMQNYLGLMVPQPVGDGTYVFRRPMNPDAKLPLIDTAGDTGKYVGAILAEPDKYEGKVFCAASGMYSLESQAGAMSRATGKTIRYQQVPIDEFLKHLPPWGDMLVEMMMSQQEFGYYGPKTAELVAWAAENARGKVHTFEEWLAEHPLPLKD